MDVRARLEVERQEAQARLEALRQDFDGVVAATRDANSDDEHDPEGHTIAFERSQTTALTQQVQRHLAEVDAALDRLARGTWGTCEGCGRPIPEARLEARPTASACVPCASRA